MRSETSRVLRPLLLGLALSLITMSIILWISFGKPGTWEYLRAMNHWILLVCLGLVFVAWCCNGIRLKLLTSALGHNLPLPRCIRITLSSEFGIAATPSGVGGGVLKVYLLRRYGVPVGQAMSMLATDVTLDFLFVLLILPLGLTTFLGIFQPVLRKPVEAVPFIVGAILIVAAASAFFWWRSGSDGDAAEAPHRSARSGTLRGLIIGGRRLIRRWKREFQTGFSTLLRLGRPALVAAFVVSVIQWSCRYGVLVLILRALKFDEVNPFALFLLQGTLFLGGLLLVIPGGGGGVEAAFVFTVSQLVPAGIAGVALILWRFFTYYLYLAGGGLMLLITVGKGGFSGSIQQMSADFPRDNEATNNTD